MNFVELKFRSTFKSIMLFEAITGKSFEIRNVSDQLLYVYCIIVACNPDYEQDFEGFLEVLDNDPSQLESLLERLGSLTRRDSLFNPTEKDSEPTQDESKKNFRN